MICAKTGMYSEATKVMKKLKKIYSEQVSLYNVDLQAISFYMGIIYEKSNKLEDAFKEFMKMIEF